MIKKIILILFFLFFSLNLQSSENKNIINNFKKIENLSFNFKQTINGKTESGECIIEYPKKINCSYKAGNKKKIISNGKFLVIKNKNNQYYHYAIERTPFQLLLDKNYILNEMQKLKGELINDKYYKYSIKNENNEINIFFNKENYQIIGWQTEDIYQNLVITYIYNLQTNNKIKKNIFRLPERN
tara:strand:- start:560 stop:1114 length:555 start_codon:yes stop_codon:yes gene_type:complete